MPIWDYDDEDVEQEVVLVSWTVMETGAGDRHFVGLTERHREGRVSSAIVAFDPENGAGKTRSGRRYRLRGRPGANVDADYAWNNWKAVNGIVSARDVTREYLKNSKSLPASPAKIWGIRYRLHLVEAVREIVLNGTVFDRAIEAVNVPEEDSAAFSQKLNSELEQLEVHNCARFRLPMEKVREWIDKGRRR